MEEENLEGSEARKDDANVEEKDTRVVEGEGLVKKKKDDDERNKMKEGELSFNMLH